MRANPNTSSIDAACGIAIYECTLVVLAAVEARGRSKW
jgi:hypothetical protein